jgi:secreted PhoX family phosphatase
VTISSDASHDLDEPLGLAFGPAGNLWVASNATNTLIEYTKAELAKSGSPAPRAIVPAPASATTSPTPDGLAIDPSGDLWVTSTDSAAFNVVAEFTKAELATAHPVPSVTISSDASGSLDGPEIPVVAPSGALWVPNAANNTVVGYTRSELTKSGSPPPYVTISANASLSNINEPDSLAFDPSGDLWVVNGSTVVELNKSELTKSGSPAPMRTIAGPKTGLDCPSSIVVQP